MNICYVLDDGLDSPDGVQQYVRAVGEYMKTQGHTVHYIAGETKQPGPNVHSMAKNMRVTFNGNALSVPLAASGAAIVQLLDKVKPDIAHVQMPYSPMLSGRVINRLSAKAGLVGTFHILPYSPLVAAGTRVLGGLQRRTLSRFDAICSVSKPAAVFLQQAFGLHSTVIPNVVDTRRFAGAKPLKQFQDDIPTVLFLGRLVARKGVLEFLHAVDELLSRPDVPAFRAVICGKGPLERDLHRYCQRRGLFEHVQFAGYVSEADKPGYLAGADIAVFPSLGGESFGIVLIEAMASGRAVVLGGNNPGYAQVLPASQLVDPKNPTGFADALVRFLTDAAAKKAALDQQAGLIRQYDIQTVGPALEAIYNKAVAKRRKSVQ